MARVTNCKTTPFQSIKILQNSALEPLNSISNGFQNRFSNLTDTSILHLVPNFKIKKNLGLVCPVKPQIYSYTSHAYTPLIINKHRYYHPLSLNDKWTYRALLLINKSNLMKTLYINADIYSVNDTNSFKIVNLFVNNIKIWNAL